MNGRLTTGMLSRVSCLMVEAPRRPAPSFLATTLTRKPALRREGEKERLDSSGRNLPHFCGLFLFLFISLGYKVQPLVIFRACSMFRSDAPHIARTHTHTHIHTYFLSLLDIFLLHFLTLFLGRNVEERMLHEHANLGKKFL